MGEIAGPYSLNSRSPVLLRDDYKLRDLRLGMRQAGSLRPEMLMHPFGDGKYPVVDFRERKCKSRGASPTSERDRRSLPAKRETEQGLAEGRGTYTDIRCCLTRCVAISGGFIMS